MKLIQKRKYPKCQHGSHSVVGKKKKKKNSLFAVIFFHTVVNMLAKSKKMDVKSQVYYPVWNITGL